MKKALLVIDVQNWYFTGESKVTYPDPNGSLDNILKVMDYAKENNMTIIVVEHGRVRDGIFSKKDGGEILPEILGKSYDYIVQKGKPSSFYDTDLEEILKKEQIEGIVISGYMTHMCCDSTAREAFHKGYSVEFLSDATGTVDISNETGTISSKDLHEAILMAQSSAFSKVLSSEEWMNSKSSS